MRKPTGQAVATILSATFLVTVLTEPSRADLVRLTGGRYHAGQIVEESPTLVRLKTGSSTGPAVISIPSQEISQIYRTLEEVKQIDQCESASELKQWAAAYYHAELRISANQCIERAWRLNPAIGRNPLDGDSDDGFRAFWNRLILKKLAAALENPDSKNLVTLARWAREAGLKNEAAFYLRRAWNRGGKTKDLVTLARTWQVNLESWIEVDLKPTLYGGLFTNSIHDQDTIVTAEPGKTFLMVPVWYDRRAGPQTLSKSIVRGPEKHGFYGIRTLRTRPDPDQLLPVDNAPIYERVELRPRENIQPDLVLKNNLGPRTNQDNSTSRQRINLRPELEAPSAWALILVEIPEETRQLTFDWGDGGSETIDLDYLRNARAAILDPQRYDPDGPDIADSLYKLKNPCGAIAELAVTQLRLIKRRLPPDRLNAWSTRVEPSVIDIAVRFEEQVRSAAWSYFTSSPSVSSAAVWSLAWKNTSVQLEWIKMIRAYNAVQATANFQVAKQLLSAILKSDDKAVCEAALNALMELDTEVDWTLACRTSETAQFAILDRLHLLPKEQVAPVLLTLMKSVRPASAAKIAQHARSLNLSLTDPRDPILEQWSELKSPAERMAFFKILGAVDLGDLIYSQSLGTIINEVTQENTDFGVRQAAITAIVDQIKYRSKRSLSAKDRFGIQGNFPVLVSVDSKDPVIKGLTEAVKSTSGAVQLDALEILLIEGFPEQAEMGLVAGTHTDDERNQILRALMARENASQSNGFLALLGRLLKKKHAANAGLIVPYLKQLIDQTSEHRWRILTAIKAGAKLENLDELVVHLEKPHSDAAKSLLHRLGHMTSQDRLRLDAATNSAEREEKLKYIDLRRAQLVDGQYGALAIVETVVREAGISSPDSTQTTKRWHIPQRTTIFLPNLTIRSSDANESYRVFWGRNELGRGLARVDVRKIQGPASFSPRLVNPDLTWRSPTGWGWPNPTGNPSEGMPALGPVIFGSWPVFEEPVPNTMTLRITDYLRTGLREAAIFGDEDIKALVPDTLKITLRYAAFSSYYGVGVTRFLPKARNKQTKIRRHLLNVMLVLEKQD